MNSSACKSTVLGLLCALCFPFWTHSQVTASCGDQKLIDTKDLHVTSRCVREDGRDLVTIRIEPGKRDPSARLRTLVLEFCGHAAVESVPIGWKASVGPWAAGSSLALYRDTDLPAPEKESLLTVALSFEGFWRHTCSFSDSMEAKTEGGVGAGGAGACSHDSCVPDAR